MNMEKSIDFIEMNDAKIYLPPQIEMVEVLIEKGFGEDYGTDGGDL